MRSEQKPLSTQDSAGHDPVALSRAEYERLAHDAACWRRYWQPDVVTLRQEGEAWRELRRFREISSAISAAIDWSAVAAAPSHAELARRRAEPVTPRRCGARDCRMVLSVPWPAPGHDVFCPRHETNRAVAA
ncbi:hypothetical protein [Amycolatopsis sp. NPDC051071]|uniref:hypothetical protein n=1 Tax=Amycolatopsis sp. NPDC051071 TaxID=3154637 RepID=UPI00342D0EF0